MSIATVHAQARGLIASPTPGNYLSKKTMVIRANFKAISPVFCYSSAPLPIENKTNVESLSDFCYPPPPL